MHQALVTAAVEGDYDELIRLLKAHLQQITTLMMNAAMAVETGEAV